MKAEKDRWRDAVEFKQASFLLTKKSFLRAKTDWLERGDTFAKKTKPGHAAYARQQASMYEILITRLEEKIYQSGYGRILHLGDKPLWKHIMDVRKGISPLQMTVDEIERAYPTAPKDMLERVRVLMGIRERNVDARQRRAVKENEAKEAKKKEKEKEKSVKDTSKPKKKQRK